MTSLVIIPRRNPSGVRRIGSLTEGAGALVKATGAGLALPAPWASPTPHAEPISPTVPSEIRPTERNRIIACLPKIPRCPLAWAPYLLLRRARALVDGI